MNNLKHIHTAISQHFCIYNDLIHVTGSVTGGHWSTLLIVQQHVLDGLYGDGDTEEGERSHRMAATCLGVRTQTRAVTVPAVVSFPYTRCVF